MLAKYIFAFLFLFEFTSCSFPEPSTKHLTAEERFDKERCIVVHRALKKFIKNMREKGYYAAGIGEGLDHSHGREQEKQNYLEVTFNAEYPFPIKFLKLLLQYNLA